MFIKSVYRTVWAVPVLWQFKLFRFSVNREDRWPTKINDRRTSVAFDLLFFFKIYLLLLMRNTLLPRQPSIDSNLTTRWRMMGSYLPPTPSSYDPESSCLSDYFEAYGRDSMRTSQLQERFRWIRFRNTCDRWLRWLLHLWPVQRSLNLTL